MTKCVMCGKKTKDRYDFCYGCYKGIKIKQEKKVSIPRPIITGQFMERMGIDRI